MQRCLDPSWPLSEACTLHPAPRRVPPALPRSCIHAAAPPAGLLHLPGPLARAAQQPPPTSPAHSSLQRKTQRSFENLKSDDTPVPLKSLQKLSIQLKNLTLAPRPCTTSLLPSDRPCCHSAHSVLTAGPLYQLLPLSRLPCPQMAARSAPRPEGLRPSAALSVRPPPFVPP